MGCRNRDCLYVFVGLGGEIMGDTIVFHHDHVMEVFLMLKFC